MNDYSDSNPPKRGTAKKIYKVLKFAGYEVVDLHYNPNNWGNNSDKGYGHWACELHNCTNEKYPRSFTGWCKFCSTWVRTGISQCFVDQVVLTQPTAPYSCILLEIR